MRTNAPAVEPQACWEPACALRLEAGELALVGPVGFGAGARGVPDGELLGRLP